MLSARQFWSKKQFTDTDSIQSYVQTRYRGMYRLDTEVCTEYMQRYVQTQYRAMYRLDTEVCTD